VLQRADANARWHRWLFGGLHRLDLTSWMRARPTWDIIVLFLMGGGLTLTATGLYLGVRRVYDDIVRVVRMASRRKPAVHRTVLEGDTGDA
jgi:hypothetical protein